MKTKTLLNLLLCAAFVLQGCASYQPQGLDSLRQKIEKSPPRDFVFTPDLKEKILTLDPEHVTGKDIKDVRHGLSRGEHQKSGRRLLFLQLLCEQ